MKEKLLTYRGYLNNLFCFLDATGKNVKFKKSRKELIESYHLLDSSNIGRTFLVKYFMVAEGDFDTYILSDLEFPKVAEEND